jgi:hypothetical protein
LKISNILNKISRKKKKPNLTLSVVEKETRLMSVPKSKNPKIKKKIEKKITTLIYIILR